MSAPDDFAILTGPDRRRPPKITWQAAVVLAISVFIVVGIVWLVPKRSVEIDVTAIGFADSTVPGTVVVADEGPCSFSSELKCLSVGFEFAFEENIESYVQEFSLDVGSPNLNVGDRVYMNVNQFEDGTLSFQYADRDRRAVVLIVTAVFAVAVVGLGKLRGVYALFGLAASVIVLLMFIVPSILAGREPVLVALVGGGAIALISLYVTHGPNPLTHVSAIGAFGALGLTTLLSWLVLAAARFSGLADEESFFLTLIPGVNLGGILLAGIVLGTIGALDDVTVTQGSAVWEVSRANPSLTRSELFAAGLRVGRDHIASTVNTLLLAYAGAALPLLILFSLADQSFGFVLSSEVIAVEIVRTLVGSIGLIAAVPLTTFLAAHTVSGRNLQPTRP